MREENYFEIKLKTCEETLSNAKSKLEHLDIQMQNCKERFEYDMKIYNDQAIHMQNIVNDMNKRIPKLKRRISKGYKAYDIRKDKGYKTYQELHEAKLAALRQESIDNYNAAKERIEKRKALIASRKPRTPEEKEILTAAELQASHQPEHELKANQEKQLEDLKKKREFYETELAKLGHELEKEVIDNKIDFIEKSMEPNDSPEEVTPVDKIIERRTEVSMNLRSAADEINGETAQIEWLRTDPEGIRMTQEYNELEGGNAIWREAITKGFRQFCNIHGYKIKKFGE